MTRIHARRRVHGGPTIGVAAFALAIASALACSRPRSPADQAADLERAQCADMASMEEAALTPLFEPAQIAGVEPLYDTPADIDGSDANGWKNGIAGAKIQVRAMPGVTAEWLDRALECHSARRTLGKLSAVEPNDPFWGLGGPPVDIQVRGQRDVFQVEIRAQSYDQGRRIFDRARAYAADVRRGGGR